MKTRIKKQNKWYTPIVRGIGKALEYSIVMIATTGLIAYYAEKHGYLQQKPTLTRTKPTDLSKPCIENFVQPGSSLEIELYDDGCDGTHEMGLMYIIDKVTGKRLYDNPVSYFFDKNMNGAMDPNEIYIDEAMDGFNGNEKVLGEDN